MLLSSLSILKTVVSVSLEVYLWIHLIAFLLSWFQPDPRRPFVQIIEKLTLPVWRWIGDHLPVRHSIAPYVSLLFIIFLQIFLVGTIQSITAAVAHQLPAIFVTKQVTLLFILGLTRVIQTVLQLFLILSLVYFVALLITSNFGNHFIRVMDGLLYPFVKPFYVILKSEQSKQFAPLLLAGAIYLLMQLIGYLSALLLTFSS